MSGNTLFGHLATKFGSHPENLATEALTYILHQSTVASMAISTYCRIGSTQVPDGLTYLSQVQDKKDKTIPDIVGIDKDNRKVVIIEAKFWASLTENQPISYLNQLQEGGVLAFVAPGMRLQSLWNELLNRCAEANLKFNEKKIKITEECRFVKLENEKTLMLCSWRSLLNSLHQALNIAGELKISNDTLQLMGLCDQMDNEAFLPIRSDELSPNIGNRIIQYTNLIRDTIQELKSLEIVSTKGRKSSGSMGIYGTSIWIYNVGCYLQFNANLWAKFRDTPLWLTFWGTKSNGNDTSIIRKALSIWETKTPPKCIIDNNELYVPLVLPLGKEKHEVVKNVVDQIAEISELLKGVE